MRNFSGTRFLLLRELGGSFWLQVTAIIIRLRISLSGVATVWRARRREKMPEVESGPYFGARLARMRCSVRRCMLRRRAVSETLRLHIS